MLLMSCGCSTMNNTEAGVVGGGLAGGVLGTIVGAAFHNPLAGAAIGAGTGAVIGGASGAAEDKRERQFEMRQAAAVAAAQEAQQPALTLEDIARLSKNNTPDSVIITQIRNSHAIYKLNADDLNYLQANNVSASVVIELQNSARQNYVNGPPVVYAQPGYIYDPYYYRPPVTVGVGFVGGGYRRW